MPNPGDERPVRIWHWAPAAAPVGLQVAELADAEINGLVWIDLGPSFDRVQLGRTIERLGLAGFDKRMLGYALHGIRPDAPSAATVIEDYDPDLAQELAQGSSVRFVAWSSFEARGAIPNHTRPLLLRRQLNILVGRDWLLTVRPPGFGVRGDPGTSRVDVTELVAHVQPRYQSVDQTPDDVATLMIHGLTRGFEPARRTLSQHLRNSDLDRWERGGVLSAPGETVTDLAFCVDAMAAVLGELEQPHAAADTAWFRPKANKTQAEQVWSMVDSTLDSLYDLRKELRSALDHQSAARAQTLLATLATFFLGPGLAAAILDAFPTWPTSDQQGRWIAFFALTLTLVLATLAAVRKVVGPTGASASVRQHFAGLAAERWWAVLATGTLFVAIAVAEVTH